MTCSQLDHFLFMTCSQLVPDLITTFTIDPQLVHDLYHTCSQLFTIFSLYFQNLLMTCSRFAYNFFTIDCVFMTCSQFVMTCSELVHDLFTSCSQLVQAFFMTFSQLVDIFLIFLKKITIFLTSF